MSVFRAHDRGFVKNLPLPALKSGTVLRLSVFIPGFFAFVVYWFTLAPTLQVGDAGEQITAGHFLGISHPTGTPLYLLVMKAWELAFPFGTIAWRMNLLNAILGSMAVILLARLILAISFSMGASRERGVFIAFCLAMVFAYSRTFWFESTGASSYVLHSVFVIGSFTLLASIVVEGKSERLRHLCLLTGLALANHVLSSVLVIMTGWLCLSLLFRRELNLKQFAVLAMFFLPGLSLYLYLPLRASVAPVLNWGDPDSLDRFLHYVMRVDYQSHAYISDVIDYLPITLFHLRSFVREVSILLPLLSSVLCILRFFAKEEHAASSSGELILARTGHPSSQLVLAGIAVFVLNVFLLGLHGSHLDIFFWNRYMMTGYFGLFFSCAVLVIVNLSHCSRRVFAIFAPILALIPTLCLFVHVEENNRSRNTLLQSYVEQVFSHLPQGACLYSVGDNHFFSLLYYHLVEGHRPDVTLLNPEMGIGDRAMLTSSIRETHLYSTHYVKTEGRLRCHPAGLLFKISEQSEMGEIKWKDFTDVEVSNARSPLEKILLAEYYHRRSLYHENRNELELSMSWARKMETVSEGYDQTLMLTGCVYMKKGMTSDAIRCFESALEINPRNAVSRFYIENYKNLGSASRNL